MLQPWKKPEVREAVNILIAINVKSEQATVIDSSVRKTKTKALIYFFRKQQNLIKASLNAQQLIKLKFMQN